MVCANFFCYIFGYLAWIYLYALHIADHVFRYDILWAPTGKFDKRRELIISTPLLELHSETFLYDATEYDGYLASVYWDFDDDQLNLVHIRPV